MKLSMIAAMARNRVIGRCGRLPWHLPDDLKRFRELTMGKPVIVGRKTFESFGRALPGRVNIVLSRDPNFNPCRENSETTSRESFRTVCLVARSPAEALALAEKKAEEAFIIGGAKVFEIFLPLVDTLYLTCVEAEVEGDSFFPPFEHLGFKEVDRVFHPSDGRHAFGFSFLRLERERKV